MSQYPTSFGKEDLLKCARGELFGPGNAQLPMPPMLMMDRITDISADGGEFGKGHVVANSTFTRNFGSLSAISPAIRLCPAVWVWTGCGS